MIKIKRRITLQPFESSWLKSNHFSNLKVTHVSDEIMATLSHSFSTAKFSTPRSSRVAGKSNIIRCVSVKHPAAAAGETLKVILAAGETGGRISPAIAIADELKALNPETEFLFVGAPSGMESIAVPCAGYTFKSISTTKLHNPYLFVKSLLQSFEILKDFGPGIVIGTGGFVSFPMCLAAAMKGIKLVVQEQNSVPGTANWVLSVVAERVFVAFNSSVDCFWQRHKCVVCGNPVRSSLRKNVAKDEARNHFFPELEQGKVVLVLGGSFGACAINIALLNSYSELLSEHEDLFIVWQTGVEAFDEMYSLVKKHPRLILRSFLHSIHLAYAAADLVVSRAGAMTCSEILATGKPSILIPSPNVEEGHQLKNALLMADLADSRVITEDELDSTLLRAAVEEIIGNERLLEEMSKRALQAAKPDAASEIARHILSLANVSK